MAAGFSSQWDSTNTRNYGVCPDLNHEMLILVPKIVTLPINMSRDGLPGVINSGSVGIRGMPTEKERKIPFLNRFC